MVEGKTIDGALASCGAGALAGAWLGPGALVGCGVGVVAYVGSGCAPADEYVDETGDEIPQPPAIDRDPDRDQPPAIVLENKWRRMTAFLSANFADSRFGTLGLSVEQMDWNSEGNEFWAIALWDLSCFPPSAQPRVSEISDLKDEASTKEIEARNLRQAANELEAADGDAEEVESFRSQAEVLDGEAAELRSQASTLMANLLSFMGRSADQFNVHGVYDDSTGEMNLEFWQETVLGDSCALVFAEQSSESSSSCQPSDDFSNEISSESPSPCEVYVTLSSEGYGSSELVFSESSALSSEGLLDIENITAEVQAEEMTRE